MLPFRLNVKRDLPNSVLMKTENCENFIFNFYAGIFLLLHHKLDKLKKILLYDKSEGSLICQEGQYKLDGVEKCLSCPAGYQ